MNFFTHFTPKTESYFIRHQLSKHLQTWGAVGLHEKPFRTNPNYVASEALFFARFQPISRKWYLTVPNQTTTHAHQ